MDYVVNFHKDGKCTSNEVLSLAECEILKARWSCCLFRDDEPTYLQHTGVLVPISQFDKNISYFT